MEHDKGEHEHDWAPCNRGICTSDLHTHHCKICGKHGFNIKPSDEMKGVVERAFNSLPSAPEGEE